MELSSARFKALTLSTGITLWFFIISSACGFFSLTLLLIFVVITYSVTQLLYTKVSKVLDIFSTYNTKLFLGIAFILVLSTYGILFRILRIDLLRLKKRNDTYWLEMPFSSGDKIFKQF